MPRPFHFFGFVGFVLLGLLFASVVALLLGFVVMWLWNWLMPVIFSLPMITFWQAWGLVVLSHIFFKSSPQHSRRVSSDDRWKSKFHEKFSHAAFHDREDDADNQ